MKDKLLLLLKENGVPTNLIDVQSCSVEKESSIASLQPDAITSDGTATEFEVAEVPHAPLHSPASISDGQHTSLHFPASVSGDHRELEKARDMRSGLVDRQRALRQVLCYICCAEFGTNSISIHHKSCLKKHAWGLDANIAHEVQSFSPHTSRSFHFPFRNLSHRMGFTTTTRKK